MPVGACAMQSDFGVICPVEAGMTGQLDFLYGTPE